jgi:hypothetical protein
MSWCWILLEDFCTLIEMIMLDGFVLHFVNVVYYTSLSGRAAAQEAQP